MKNKKAAKSGKSSKEELDLEKLLGQLGGEDGDDDDEWEKAWDARQKGLEEVLGKSADGVLHAAFPLAFGGNADVLIFPKYPGGVAYVTADLTLSEVGQKANSLGNFELMICSRREEGELGSLISGLARKTTEGKIEVGDVLDLSVEKDAPAEAILFCEGPKFKAAGKEWGLLLCLLISKEESARAKRDWKGVVEARKKAGTFPFSEPQRKPFHEKPFWSDMPGAAEEKDFKGAPAGFVKTLSEALRELRAKLDGLDRKWKLGSFAKWDYAQDSNELIFTLLDGSRLKCKGQIVGSRSSQDGSWEWAWNNPHVDKSSSKLSLDLKKLGTKQKNKILTAGQTKKLSMGGAWALLALAVKESKGSGGYCGNAGPIDVFIAFDLEKVEQ